MKLAMEEASNFTVAGAARKYGIPLATLQRHIKKGSEKKNIGRYKLVFTPEQEADLETYLLHMDSLFYGLTKKDFQTLAYDFAEKNKIIHPFKNKTAGDDWYVGFRRRHPNVTLRQPEPTSIARARGFNRHRLKDFLIC